VGNWPGVLRDNRADPCGLVGQTNRGGSEICMGRADTDMQMLPLGLGSSAARSDARDLDGAQRGGVGAEVGPKVTWADRRLVSAYAGRGPGAPVPYGLVGGGCAAANSRLWGSTHFRLLAGGLSGFLIALSPGDWAGPGSAWLPWRGREAG